MTVALCEWCNKKPGDYDISPPNVDYATMICENCFVNFFLDEELGRPTKNIIQCNCGNTMRYLVKHNGQRYEIGDFFIIECDQCSQQWRCPPYYDNTEIISMKNAHVSEFKIAGEQKKRGSRDSKK
jgi:hypothetical protein